MYVHTHTKKVSEGHIPAPHTGFSPEGGTWRERWKSYLYFPPVSNVLLKMVKLVLLS